MHDRFGNSASTIVGGVGPGPAETNQRKDARTHRLDKIHAESRYTILTAQNLWPRTVTIPGFAIQGSKPNQPIGILLGDRTLTGSRPENQTDSRKSYEFVPNFREQI